MKVYLLLGLIAAAITYVLVPLARHLALKSHAITAVRERDVHTIPTPRMGGLAMLAGITAAIVMASHIPFLRSVFDPAVTSGIGPNAPWAILGAAVMVTILGILDDIWDLDWMTKLSGQILAGVFMAWQGVQLTSFPIAGLTVGSSRLSLVATVAVVVLCMNAVNFVDGLDGLAAGLVGIGAAAFFTYTYLISASTGAQSYASLASLLLVITVGVCVGFLPHNFHPARIFMGDSGSMLLGLMFAAATIAVTGQVDPQAVTLNARQIFPILLPIVLPFAVLALPLLDTLMAVVRRLRAGQSPFRADRMHLHHRMLALGHTHRRAVLILYLWTALISFGGAALARFSASSVLIWLAVGAAIVLVLTLGPLAGRRRGATPDLSIYKEENDG